MKKSTNAKGPGREEAIRIEAYLLSEQAGHPTGMESVFWVQAEAIVHSRLAAVAAAVEMAAAKKTAPRQAAGKARPKLPAKAKASASVKTKTPAAVKSAPAPAAVVAPIAEPPPAAPAPKAKAPKKTAAKEAAAPELPPINAALATAPGKPVKAPASVPAKKTAGRPTRKSGK